MYIRPLSPSDLKSFIAFTDEVIGVGYFKPEDFSKILKSSTTSNGEICSYVLTPKSSNDIAAIRLSFPPGVWLNNFELPIQKNWPLPSSQVAYFKSLFVHPSCQNRGWGPKLSTLSENQLKNLGAKAIIAHAWKESPGGSSLKYLEKFGFQKQIEIKKFWHSIDYVCETCAQPKCVCTAIQVIKYL